MADLCLTCGHKHRHHSGLANMIDCDIPGCTCTKFEPADPKIEQTPDLDCSCGGRWISDGQGGFGHTPTDSPAMGGHVPLGREAMAAEIKHVLAGSPDLDQAIHADAVYMVEQLQQQRNDWVTRASRYARERDDVLERLAQVEQAARDLLDAPWHSREHPAAREQLRDLVGDP